MYWNQLDFWENPYTRVPHFQTHPWKDGNLETQPRSGILPSFEGLLVLSLLVQLHTRATEKWNHLGSNLVGVLRLKFKSHAFLLGTFAT